ncbi:butyrophilin-like protein 1 [Rhynchocyon petersi]
MEDGSSCSLFCYLTSLLLFLQLFTQGSADEFLVIGPKDPIVAVLGRDIILPCYLSPAMSVENMELRWFRSKFSEPIFLYKNQQEQKEEKMPQYTGRTSLVKDFLTQGHAAVRINKVEVSDNGVYTCMFRKGRFYDDATLEVKVAGMGFAPEVGIEGLEEDGVRVLCTAFGWFPRPQIQWRDLSGKKFLNFPEAHTQDANGLFHVKASLVVRDSSVGNVTCSILNPILGEEKVKAIFIPEPFFPQTFPWKSAFVVSLTMLVIFIFGAGYYFKRTYSENLEKLKSLQLIMENTLKARDWMKGICQICE